MASDATHNPQDLRAFQGAFAAALLDARPRLPPLVSRASDADAARRFGIYRNNVTASLSAALAARFPVVGRLVGVDFFRAMALRFVEHHPPRSPVLSTYGVEFPDFLDRFEPAAALAYLSDVARLEWARAVAYHAADDRPLDITILSSIPSDRLHDVRLTLHAGAQVVVSEFPIVSIWRTNTYDDTVRAIGPDLPGEAALVSRPALDVLVTSLPQAAARLIAHLAAGDTLGAAAKVATEHDPEIDLSDALALLFGAGAVIDVEDGP
jgi:hypothetical protein